MESGCHDLQRHGEQVMDSRCHDLYTEQVTETVKRSQNPDVMISQRNGEQVMESGYHD